jgi:hypothetical protein
MSKILVPSWTQRRLAQAIPVGNAGRDVQNLIIVLRVIVTLLVTPTGPPFAR